MDKEKVANHYTVKKLRALLNSLDDSYNDMEVVIPIIDDEDDIRIHGFFNVNSVSIIDDKYCDDKALLIATVAKNKTINEELSSSFAKVDTYFTV